MAGIKELLDRFIENWASKEEIYLKVGTASKIDLSERTFTFTPNDETAPVLAQLKAVATPTGGSLVIVPKDGSIVAVAFYSSTTAVCVMVESADQIIMSADSYQIAATKTIQVDAGEKIDVNSPIFNFNGGNNGGLIIISQLVAKLNVLRDAHNDLVSRFNSHTHTGVSTGSGTSGPKSGNNVGTAPVFNKNDFENEIVKH